MAGDTYRISLGIVIPARAPRRCRTGGDAVTKQIVVVCLVESTTVSTAIAGVLLSCNVVLTLEPLCATVEGCLVTWVQRGGICLCILQSVLLGLLVACRWIVSTAGDKCVLFSKEVWRAA